MVEALPDHHVSVGIIQAATTVDPYLPKGTALVSHRQLWCTAVLKKYFHAAVEVDSLEQCFPPRTPSASKRVMACVPTHMTVCPIKHDEFFLRSEEKLIHPRGPPTTW